MFYKKQVQELIVNFLEKIRNLKKMWKMRVENGKIKKQIRNQTSTNFWGK